MTKIHDRNELSKYAPLKFEHKVLRAAIGTVLERPVEQIISFKNSIVHSDSFPRMVAMGKGLALICAIAAIKSLA